MQPYIALFKSEVNRQLINGEIVEEYQNIPAIKVLLSTEEVLSLQKHEEIISVEQDKPIKVSLQQTPSWGVNHLNTAEYRARELTGKGVRVAVIDSGISQHEDLTITGGISFVPNVSSYHDDNGHGTHVAGIIGAKNNDIGIVGIAPDSSLYAVKVLDKDGFGYPSSVISGIDWAITNKMDIINLSLGFEYDFDSLREIVDKAFNSGILVVAAGGNSGNADGTGNSVAYPARYESVIGVSAIDINNIRPSFSSTGDTIEIAAPGVNIMSTIPSESNGTSTDYASASGTSMAAPFVAGYLALLKQAYPYEPIQNIRMKLQSSAIDLGITGRDAQYGFGLAHHNLLGPERINGKDRFEVAVNISKKGWKTSDTVVIANYLAFADALSAAPLAFKYDAPILLTHPDKLTAITKQEINRLQAKNVIIIGGTGSVSNRIEDEIRGLIKGVSRISGEDRFEVSYNIANKLNPNKQAIIANGLIFSDALAIAPYAAKNQIPILLTSSTTIPTKVQDSLNQRGVTSTLVIGGEATINESVYKKLPGPTRISGKDRYEVSSNIINKLNMQSPKVFIATGTSFADALTGSVLMAKENTSILLTRKDNLPDTVNNVIKTKNYNTYVILGGTGSVSDGVYKYLLGF
jgi:subtilisin family serine protease